MAVIHFFNPPKKPVPERHFFFKQSLAKSERWRTQKETPIWLKEILRISIAMKHASYFLCEIAVFFHDRIEYYDPERN